MKIAPTKLLIFDSSKAGTPRRLAAPRIAIDLTLKSFVWQNSRGQEHRDRRDVGGHGCGNRRLPASRRGELERANLFFAVPFKSREGFLRDCCPLDTSFRVR